MSGSYATTSATCRVAAMLIIVAGMLPACGDDTSAVPDSGIVTMDAALARCHHAATRPGHLRGTARGPRNRGNHRGELRYHRLAGGTARSGFGMRQPRRPDAPAPGGHRLHGARHGATRGLLHDGHRRHAHQLRHGDPGAQCLRRRAHRGLSAQLLRRDLGHRFAEHRRGQRHGRGRPVLRGDGLRGQPLHGCHRPWPGIPRDHRSCGVRTGDHRRRRTAHRRPDRDLR